MTQIDTAALADLLKELLAAGRQMTLTVSSDSMAPLLRPGDQVVVTPVSLDLLTPGDVVTMTAVPDLLTHRFWGLSPDGSPRLLTRGDRPLTFDSPRPVSDLIGRIYLRRRDGADLALDKGLGGWLNRHLAWLAAAEWRWLAQAAPPVSKTIPAVPQRRLSIRLIRRLIYAWACLLTAVIGRLARSQSPSAL